MPIIEITHVTKEYRLGQITSLRGSAMNLVRRIRRQPVIERTRFKALDDINFSVEKGEVVGIIGHNGAGKSTLLKILSRVTTPTQGTVAVHGKVAPLIEVGAGLSPELTGRENIYLNGSILGITKVEIRKKFDDIVAFAELEEFIDTPIKRYSSGMKIKLGFSIATSIDAEILIVDEVLAVGDLAFQRKCFDRMDDLIKSRGNTVLLVSHNIRQVERLCKRVITLDHGTISEDGSASEVCRHFYEKSNETISNYYKSSNSLISRIKGSGEVELLAIEILDENGESADSVFSGSTLRVRARLKVNHFVEKPEVVIGTHTTDFFYLSASSTALFDERPDFTPGEHIIECIIPSFPLAPGTYCLWLAVFDQYRRLIFSGETLKSFSVVNPSNEAREPSLRVLNLSSQWLIDGTSFAPSELNDNVLQKCEV